MQQRLFRVQRSIQKAPNEGFLEKLICEWAMKDWQELIWNRGKFQTGKGIPEGPWTWRNAEKAKNAKWCWIRESQEVARLMKVAKLEPR